MKHLTITEVCQKTGVDPKRVHVLIEREWLLPVSESDFDEEDLARVNLILELERDFGANEEAIPIILHLMDQLHFVHGKLREFGNRN